MYILITTESESSQVYVLYLRALFRSSITVTSNVHYLCGKYIAIILFHSIFLSLYLNKANNNMSFNHNLYLRSLNICSPFNANPPVNNAEVFPLLPSLMYKGVI